MASGRAGERRAVGLTIAVSATALLTACEQPQPRGFIEYMEDAVAREATLVRCNQDRQASALDLECANARRAAAAVAARNDHARQRELEQQSERKRAELRARVSAQQAAERAAQEAAALTARAEYEAQWGALPEGSEPVVATELDRVPGSAYAGRSLDPAVRAEEGAVVLALSEARATLPPAELADARAGAAGQSAVLEPELPPGPAAPSSAMPRPFRDDTPANP